jgi:glycosyltransferase involved in cell wall biosynthesis
MKMSSVGLAPYYSNRGFVTNIPNKPIEYLSAGLPVVSSLQGVLKTLLDDNKCGVTYQNGDVEGLTKVLLALYDGHEVLNELSRNAYRLFEERFSSEKVYGDMCDYLVKIASQSKYIHS